MKKIIQSDMLWTSYSFVVAVWVSLTASLAFGLNGDVNGDGVVDIQDSRMIGKYLTGQVSSIPNSVNADATQDGQVNMEDAFAIAKHVAGQSRILQTYVRHAQSSAFHTGDPVCVRISEHFFPFSVTNASVRIRSEKNGYDSSPQPLAFEQDGRALYFNWPTSLREPSDDYKADLTTYDVSGTTIHSATLSLQPEMPDKYILASQTDLMLPFWDIGLHMTRSFPYTSAYYGYKGIFGYGWIHTFGPTLTEFTDGSVLIYDTMGKNRGRGKNDTYYSTPGDGRYYSKSDAGNYDSMPGDYSVFTRDPDGSFHLRLVTGEVWKFGSDHRPLWFKSITDRKVNFLYDEKGRLSVLSDDSGQQITLVYNSSDLVVSATDSTGREVVYGYDPAGYLVSVTDPAGNTIVYDYDSQYRLSKISFPDGRHRYFLYDDESRQLKRVASDGGWYMNFDFTQTPEGLQEIDTDALGRSSRTLCNARGLLVEAGNNLGQKTVNHYDASGHLVGVTDPANNLWGMIPDATGNPVQTTDPEARTVSTSYSSINNGLASLVDGNGQEMNYQYYENGEIACVTYPDGSTEMFAYTNTVSGRTAMRKLRNDSLINYESDPRGLMMKKILPGGEETTFAYDVCGNLTNAANNALSIAFKYDILSRVTRVTYPGNRVIRYEYDSMSRRTRMVDPDGRDLAYVYNAAGLLSTITDADTGLIVTYTYNAAGQVIERLLANGVETNYGYDPAGRLSGIVSRNALNSIIANYSYTFDCLGNVLTKETLVGSESYGYDKTLQITDVTYASGVAENILYDDAANVETVIRSGQGTEEYFVNDLNQYVSAGLESFTYDGNGNLATRTMAGSTISFLHDAENQLTQVQLTNGSTVAYSYDPLGRIASRTDTGGTVFYLWDGNSMLIEEGADHVTQACHTRGKQVNEIVSTRRGVTAHFYLQDRLLSVSEVLNQAGQVLQYCAYSLNGGLNSGSLAGTAFGFSGSLYDEATGLYNMRARWYLPELGRFIEPDPIGVAGGLNIYTYADNNPANRIDFFGLCSAAGGGGGYSGGASYSWGSTFSVGAFGFTGTSDSSGHSSVTFSMGPGVGGGAFVTTGSVPSGFTVSGYAAPAGVGAISSWSSGGGYSNGGMIGEGGGVSAGWSWSF